MALPMAVKRAIREEAGAFSNTRIVFSGDDEGRRPFYERGRVVVDLSWLAARFGSIFGRSFDWAVSPHLVARVLGGCFADDVPAGVVADWCDDAGHESAAAFLRAVKPLRRVVP